jgi:hypothetical protein
LSSTVNVRWEAFNLVVADIMVARAGRIDPRRMRHAVVLGHGALFVAQRLERHFDEFHGGNL